MTENIANVSASTGVSEVVVATTEELTDIQNQQLTVDEATLKLKQDQLALTDVYMARMCEDLIDVLVANGTIALTDLPQGAQDKLNERAQLRVDIAALEA